MRGEGGREERENMRKGKWAGGRRGKKRKEGREGISDLPGHFWCNIIETSAAVTNQLP